MNMHGKDKRVFRNNHDKQFKEFQEEIQIQFTNENC